MNCTTNEKKKKKKMPLIKENTIEDLKNKNPANLVQSYHPPTNFNTNAVKFYTFHFPLVYSLAYLFEIDPLLFCCPKNI